MLDLPFDPLIAACAAAFAAGFIDAIVGGGGLIQLPALIVIYPAAPIALLLGTNKLSSVAGTATAILTYARRITLPWRILIPASGAAFLASAIGAKLAAEFPPHHLKPLIFVILIAVFLYTLFRPGLGLAPAEELPSNARQRLSAAAAVIGAYDGFLGPGTGNFLIFTMVRWIKMPFLLATASAKVINGATNLAAVILFALTSNISYAVAVPMAAANVAGGYLGARLAIARGSPFIRIVFIGVVALLLARIGADLLS